MESIVFRRLLASEIDCRIGQMSKNGSSAAILLYKNARVDMAILDETLGAFGWQRDHKEIKGNLYAGVGILNDGEWVWKWDCGTESNTEKEKGEASDSFKRACVNWGIGRELYTAPKIWVNLYEDEASSRRINLSVKEIAYNDNGEITDLEIIDDNLNTRFCFKNGRSTRLESNVPSVSAQNTAANARRANAGRGGARSQQSAAPTPGYQPMEEKMYRVVVSKYVQGIPSQSGSDYRSVWAEMTHAGAQELKMFDVDCALERQRLGIA